MPCFKGIAVSIHANGAPLPEYGIQKQSRFSRISTYIPVPPPQLSGTNKPEPARFAISITLLTPGLAIPYSMPKPTENNPKPKPEYVGNLPSGNEAMKAGAVTPYIPMTNSSNETIAAYIYFDGRTKEEVATLLRPGEETWVNSRWVQVPDAEGGGLAEREFLFREVGLERWLNGLDLQGDDAQAKLEKRRRKFEKRRRRQRAEAGLPDLKDANGGSGDVLRYGADDASPVQAVFDEDPDSSSDDDEPPEATGQIKVSMFRVLASGEIKKGEYSPQFDAHDDDDELETSAPESNSNLALDADVEHTTSFAKPKTLDPSTISTQTVTGIDGPDKPYATFTFFYRGERQLQKVGVLAPKSSQQQTPGSSKRRSTQLDFSSLGPLKTSGTVGFSAFRDANSEAARRRKARKRTNGSVGGALQDDSEDDDDDDELLGKMHDIDEKGADPRLPSEETTFQGELADGVGRMRLKRAHSADPDAAAKSSGVALTTEEKTLGKVAGSGAVDVVQAVAPPGQARNKSPGAFASAAPETASPAISDDGARLGSPLKKHRPSLGGPAGLDGMLSALPAPGRKGEISTGSATLHGQAMDDEEEL